MKDSIRQSNESSVTARLKNLIKEISELAENASEEQKQTLLSLLEKRRLLELLEIWRQEDRRTMPRKRTPLSVHCYTKDQAFEDSVRDISSTGVFIETSALLSVGEEITLSFSSPHSEEPVKVTGEIVWTGPGGVGVEFKAASKDLEAIIKTL